MNTDLISNQVALFFNKFVKEEDLKSIKSWLIDECKFELINSFGMIDDAPPDFPLVQTKKVEGTTTYRVNISKSRLDMFIEPMTTGVKYEALKEAVIENVGIYLEKIYELGIELARIGCVNSMVEQMTEPEAKTKDYIAAEVREMVAGQEIIDASIRINTREVITIGERQVNLNKIFQVINGSGFINRIEYKGMILSIDVNNIPGGVLNKVSAISLFTEMSSRVTEGEIEKRLLN